MLSRLLVVIAFVSVGNFAWCQTHAIVNVTIINVRGDKPSIPSQTVILRNRKIVQIGPSSEVRVPTKATVIDGQGKFLIPGLWDMHVHLSYYGPEAYPMLLKNGVTSVRDMGGDVNDFRNWGVNGVHPDVYYAGPFVDGPKQMDPLVDISNTRKISKVFHDGKVIDK